MKPIGMTVCFALCLLCLVPSTTAQCLKAEKNKIHNPFVALNFSLGRTGTAFGEKASAAIYPLPCLNVSGFWEFSKAEGISTHGGMATVHDSKAGPQLQWDAFQVHGLLFSSVLRIGIGPARVLFTVPNGSGGTVDFHQVKHEIQATPDLRIAHSLRNGVIVGALVGRNFGGLAAQTFGGLDLSLFFGINPSPKGIKQLFDFKKN